MLFNCILERIVKGRLTRFTFKNSVCITTNFISWSCCKPNKQTIEVSKNGGVSIKNRTVGFIYNNQIKTAG